MLEHLPFPCPKIEHGEGGAKRRNRAPRRVATSGKFANHTGGFMCVLYNADERTRGRWWIERRICFLRVRPKMSPKTTRVLSLASRTPQVVHVGMYLIDPREFPRRATKHLMSQDPRSWGSSRETGGCKWRVFSRTYPSYSSNSEKVAGKTAVSLSSLLFGGDRCIH